MLVLDVDLIWTHVIIHNVPAQLAACLIMSKCLSPLRHGQSALYTHHKCLRKGCRNMGCSMGCRLIGCTCGHTRTPCSCHSRNGQPWQYSGRAEHSGWQFKGKKTHTHTQKTGIFTADIFAENTQLIWVMDDKQGRYTWEQVVKQKIVTEIK